MQENVQNYKEKLKSILQNKNTVTIIGVIAGVITLYLFYNWRVKEAVQPITVPYSKVEISSRTQITEDMIGYISVPKGFLKKSDNIMQNAADIIDNFAAYGVTIPANSFFYAESVMTKDKLPKTTFTDEEVKDGYTVYSLPVDLHTTYGNSICPGNYIDLYLKANDDNKIIFGKFIESIEVLDVRDDNGDKVFETSAESRAPQQLLFAVPDDLYLLLMKSQYINAGIQVIPVPRNASYSEKDDDTTTKVSSDYIRDFVLSKTASIPDNVVKDSNNNSLNTNIGKAER